MGSEATATRAESLPPEGCPQPIPGAHGALLRAMLTPALAEGLAEPSGDARHLGHTHPPFPLLGLDLHKPWGTSAFTFVN